MAADATAPPPTAYQYKYADAANAAVQAINRSGGINGRRLALTFCDTHSNPDTAVACARQSTSGKFVAVVGLESYFDQLMAPIFKKGGIPLVGAIELNSAQALSLDTAFPSYSGLPAQLLGFGRLAKLIGGHKVAVWTSGGLPTTDLALHYTTQGIAAAGLQLGKVVEPPVTTTDPSADITQALSGGADVLALEDFNPSGLPTVVRYVHANYPHVKIIVNSFLLDNNVLAAMGSEADGIYAPAWTGSPWHPAAPGAGQFVSEMRAYHGLHGEDTSDAAVLYWLGVHMFAEIAKSIKGPITAQSVLAQARRTENLNLGGLVLPFSASQRGKFGTTAISNATVVPWVVKNGEPTDLLKPNQFLDVINGKLTSGTVAAKPLQP